MQVPGYNKTYIQHWSNKIGVGWLCCCSGSYAGWPTAWQRIVRFVHRHSAGSVGLGALFQGRWAFQTWPLEWQQKDLDITVKELFPIVVTLQLWGNRLQNQKVIFHCDNQALVQIINIQTTCTEPSMRLLRILVLSCLTNNILLGAKHIQGHKNNIADTLSRCQFSRFWVLAPEADETAMQMPQSIWLQLQLT